VPEKRNRRAAARNDDAGSFISADGVIGRLVDQTFDNPAMSGGLFVMALTASAIVSNALFLQNVRHPEPLFSTRPPLVIERHAPGSSAVPIPPHRDDATGSIAPPLPRPAPIPPMAMVEAQPAAESETLIREIQTVLARKGLYLGAIDGEFGALSRSAITAYEKAEGLPVTGEPSAALLERLKTAAAAPPASPPPVVAAIPPELPSPSVATAPVQELAPRTPQGPSPQEIEAELKRLRYERVQTALNRIGYGPVAVDGAPNQETINAIRRFELDNGLPISGLAGDGVVDRLIAIGALPAT
jgi:peptidoglycan hydrolase-like protein with peptidoglycan-binding domain